MKTRYEQRRERLRESMYGNNVQALLITDVADRFYLSGFEYADIHTRSCAGFLLVTATGEDILFTDSRFFEVAKKVWDEDAIILYTTQEDVVHFLKNKYKTTPIAVEPSSINASFYLLLQEHCSIVHQTNMVSVLRAIKDSYELSCIRESVALNHKLMQRVQKTISAGITEYGLAWNIEQFYKSNGASYLAFPSIVAFGKNGALPHYTPETFSVTLEEDMPVLIDCGAVYKNYCSDQTRTFWFGEHPTQEFLQAYEYTEEAQRRAIQTIRAGVTLESVYLSAWEYFDSVGVSEYFIHSLGHGIGLFVHEYPRLSRGVTEPLKENMVVTVEPGLYYPQWGGVRIENMVLVTKDGCEVL